MTTTTLPKQVIIPIGISLFVSGIVLVYLGGIAVTGGTITWTKGA